VPLRIAVDLLIIRHRCRNRSGCDRDKDIAALADKIAAVVELFNHDGALVQLDPTTGKPIPVNLAAFRDLIANSIAGVRVVNRGGGGVWRCEFVCLRTQAAI
jgi:hypothetical protein